MEALGFFKAFNDPCLIICLWSGQRPTSTSYMKSPSDIRVIGIRHVDDILFSGPDPEHGIQSVLKLFKSKDMGKVGTYLGMKIVYNQSGQSLSLTQRDYAEQAVEELTRGSMHLSRVATPIQVLPKLADGSDHCPDLHIPILRQLGCLMYAMTCSRPDLAFAASAIARCAHRPTQALLTSTKRMIRYWWATANAALTYQFDGQEDLNLHLVVDSSFADDPDHRYSTAGFLALVGEPREESAGVEANPATGTAISWWSGRIRRTATSSAEAEYVALYEAVCEALWLRSLFAELGHPPTGPTPIFIDSTSAISLATVDKITQGRKHVDVLYHASREAVDAGKIKLHYVNTAQNTADALTKVLGKDQFERHRAGMGIGL